MPPSEQPPKPPKPSRKRKPPVAAKLQTRYALCLYVSGSTLNSARAVENIKRISDQHLKNRYTLEVIDVYQQPDLARGDQIVAVPTLIKRFPFPLRRLIGDLSNTKSVLLALDLTRQDP